MMSPSGGQLSQALVIPGMPMSAITMFVSYYLLDKIRTLMYDDEFVISLNT